MTIEDNDVNVTDDTKSKSVDDTIKDISNNMDKSLLYSLINEIRV